MLFLRKTIEARIITVIDGDTVVAVQENGKRHKIRLHAIDAPEVGQPGSEDSTNFLKELTLGKWARIRILGKDRYRRLVGRIRVHGMDVSKSMVQNAMAFPIKGKGLWLQSLLPRIFRQGVWRYRLRPHNSLKRRFRILGWLAWRVARHQRKKKKR